jgi:hypothetical protein
VIEDGSYSLGFSMGKRLQVRHFDRGQSHAGPHQLGRLVGSPIITGLITPYSKPFRFGILGISVTGANHCFRTHIKVTPEESCHAPGLMPKKILHRLNLPCRPTLVRIQLPKKTLIVNERQGGPSHLHFAIPEQSAWFLIDFHLARKLLLEGI